MQGTVILLTAAGLAAGCGSSSSPSAQSFRRDANRICSHYGRKAEAASAHPGQTARVQAKTIALLEQMNRKFERLTPPRREERRFRHFLAVQRQSLREMKRIQRFTAMNEPKALMALKRERPRRHIPPEQALEHPTGATLAEAMTIPAVARYLRGLDRLARASAESGRNGDRLMKQLHFTACL
jgi:hypothetical protein